MGASHGTSQGHCLLPSSRDTAPLPRASCCHPLRVTSVSGPQDAPALAALAMTDTACHQPCPLSTSGCPRGVCFSVHFAFFQVGLDPIARLPGWPGPQGTHSELSGGCGDPSRLPCAALPPLVRPLIPPPARSRRRCPGAPRALCRRCAPGADGDVCRAVSESRPSCGAEQAASGGAAGAILTVRNFWCLG